MNIRFVIAAFAAFSLLPCISIAAEDLATVVVTATRSERALEDVPTPTEVITRKTIGARGVGSFNEAVNAATGVFAAPGRGISEVSQNISLHGVPNSNRTLVLLDGQPINDPFAGSLNLGGLPVDLLDRVEVSQGPGSALYGGSAMGGVIHYISRMPTGREATLRVGYGDATNRGQAPANTRWLSFTGGNRLENGLSFLAGIAYRSTNGFPAELNVTTTAPTAGISGAQVTSSNTGVKSYLIGDKGSNYWKDQSLTLRASMPLEGGSRVTGSYVRQAYDYGNGAPTSYLRNAAGAEVFSYTGVLSNSFNPSYGGFLRDILNFSYETRVGQGDLKVGLGYSTIPKSWFVVTGLTAATTLTEGPGRISLTKADSWSADGQWTVALGNHSLTVGCAVKREIASSDEKSLGKWNDPASLSAAVSSARGKADTVAFFAQDEWLLGEATTAWLGGRWDYWTNYEGFAWNSLSGAAGAARNVDKRSASAFSPKLSVAHRLIPQLAVRASVGTAFRPPTTFELYRTFGTGTVIQNNPDLAPEKSTTYDLGLEAKPWAGSKLGINFFRNNFRNLIYSAGSGAVRQRTNAGAAESHGVQLSIEQKFGSDTKVFLNATEQSSAMLKNTVRPTSEGKQLTFMPKSLLNIGLESRRGPWSFSATARHASRQFRVDDNSDVVTGIYDGYDAFTVADSRIAYRREDGAEFGLTISNLTDQKYFAPNRAPGRSWSLELTQPF